MQLLMKSCPCSRELWKKADLASFSPVTYWLTCFHSGTGSLDKELCLGDMSADGNILCAGKFSISNFHSPFLHSVSLCHCWWRCALQQSLRRFACSPCPVCFALFPGLSEGKTPNMSNSAPGGPDQVLETPPGPQAGTGKV